MAYIISYDIGTTGVKTCLFQVEKTISLVDSQQEGYDLFILENGGAEQDVNQWWEAMCNTTRRLMEKTGLSKDAISGISFCSQMQGLVLVDKDGKALRRAMSYMDQRASKEIKEGIAYGPQIAGANIFKLIKSLIMTGAVSSSVKDPVWKYHWVRNNEPEIFQKVYKWLDVKEYLVLRCTGEFVMTPDSAFSTFLYDTRPGHEGFSKSLCKLYDVNYEHLPRIVGCNEQAGGLTETAAQDLGLAKGTPVFGGGGDATLIGIGAGCVKSGQTHVYCGTSGWVSTIVDKQMVDTQAMIAAIVGAQESKYNYFAEMETAGKSLEWVKDHLALDEIGVYLDKKEVAGHSQECVYVSLYDYLTEVMKRTTPGSKGVIFTPWLHGNRCPFEDKNAAGMFFNIQLETGKTEMIRAVVEGVVYHIAWMLECQDKKTNTSKVLRFCGGGALSDVSCQILADVTGRLVEVVHHPQNVGAVGAAALVATGLDLIPDWECVGDFIPVEKTFVPDEDNHKAYQKYYNTFKKLYQANKKLFRELNEV